MQILEARVAVGWRVLARRNEGGGGKERGSHTPSLRAHFSIQIAHLTGDKMEEERRKRNVFEQMNHDNLREY